MAHATTGTDRGLARLMTDACRTLSSALRRAARGDERAVHRARVASRRLREVLPIAGAAAPHEGAARVRRDVRAITRALGPVRDIDVSMAVLAEAAAEHGWPADHVTIVQREFQDERDRLRRRMQGRLAEVSVDRIAERSRAIGRSAAQAGSQWAWRRALASRLRARAARLVETINACGTLYAPERLHAVRIAAKKLRYALELARDAAGLPVGPLIATLRNAQQRLGSWRDRHVLAERVRAVAAGRHPGRAAARRIADMAAALERDCRALHADFLTRTEDLTELARRAARDTARSVAGPRLAMIKAGALRVRGAARVKG
jgi:CHAD domain-containing protein